MDIDFRFINTQVVDKIHVSSNYEGTKSLRGTKFFVILRVLRAFVVYGL